MMQGVDSLMKSVQKAVKRLGGWDSFDGSAQITLAPEESRVRPSQVRASQRNEIHTTRFTFWTWIPKSLYYQFHRAANIYFVFIAIIATIPFVHAKWQPKVLTVLLILLAQALKEMYEDCKRRQDDHAENYRTVHRYDFRAKTFEEVHWQDILMGDILLIEKGELFPADTLVLASSDTSGVFHVETKSIDGETNLKERSAPHAITQKVSREDAILHRPSSFLKDRRYITSIVSLLLDLGPQITLAAASPSISDLDGTISISGNTQGSSAANFGLRGCSLQNTHWVLGVSCYIGNKSKVMLNSFAAPTKTSELERYLNSFVLAILAFLLMVSLYFALASRLVEHVRMTFFHIFLQYLVILYPVLPMTLYIAFEVMHLIIGLELEADARMEDASTGLRAKVRNTSILGSVGQVDFVFSDKTGTLTTNEMRFAYCCTPTAQFGPFLPNKDGSLGHGHSTVRRKMLAGDAEANALFEALATCHTIKIDEDGTYQGESPDEVALVQAACQAGHRLQGRDKVGSRYIYRIQNELQHTEKDCAVTHVLAFTSDRKRMSVVCATEDGGALLLTKGADSVMERLLEKPLPASATCALLDFSKEGLRTLLWGRRRISSAEYQSFCRRWDEADQTVESRSGLLDSLASGLETGLTFVGLTALEDRLQDLVPATIATLRDAGIRVWVLTGDKVETALEIAKSCKLVEPDMHLVSFVNTSSLHECTQILREALLAAKRDKTGQKRGAIVLDGSSASMLLQDPETRSALYCLAALSSSCVCCRLSPLQKRELVDLVREQNPRSITLAIGDGANDVPMIEGAHVGIGIRGKEGSGAVQASDIAVSQFRFLGSIILCHGRNSYRRVATFLCFFIYKSVALGWSYIVYAHSMLFSGEGAYPQWLDIIWNPLTSCAVVLILASDVDIPDEVALVSPEWYAPGPKRQHFNLKVFGKWMFTATVHGCLAWCIPVYSLTSREERVVRPLPPGGPFWQASFTAFTSIFLLVHLKLFLIAEKPVRPVGLIMMIVELAVYVPAAVGLGSSLAPSHELLGAPLAMLRSWHHLACIVAVLVSAFLADTILAGGQPCRRRTKLHMFPLGQRTHSRSLVSLAELARFRDAGGGSSSTSKSGSSFDSDSSDEELGNPNGIHSS
mmetsp:Transcript_80072/g.166544  ORF Transcript_80072/g.166544 Transcript_80072/m.166544 type:complete len:1134 (+) Transcript_80072:121-3522(+)|eukprot:CAMPEP_0206494146 /NCGR_PEP_ID=MMETSP0324_2-20121206/47523_1 /ASSEMBLY_ACC=CAM_ASM_000836 /TAXON_ID=2866 /ORGANISM="Crypthecodinium cohnii, Strain Seligo" /LENGTH=1133 /DNA_ID=CAMNT_0053977683 /DNA_START=160 /DNA_END=3561 /DNA_ORIENTATION=-